MPRLPRAQHKFREADLPPPAGINSVDPASQFGPEHAIYIVNALSGTLGLQARPGTQEWATNVGTLPPAEVRSLLSYHGSTVAKDRLFACTHDGVYDVTAGGAAPPRVLAFGVDNANSGHGVAVAYTTSGGRFLLYADEANGYQLYTEGTDTWAAGSVTGVAASALVHVLQWKNRVWFTEVGSSRAWYLGLGAISGAATKFDFGLLFRHGGSLVGLYTWTVDGGNGSDDFLVACSSSGDVVLFRGTDPVASDFGQVGVWFLGGFPTGRRVATQFGGDVLLLTLQGVISLQKLVSGQLVSPDTYETRNLRPIIVAAMADQQLAFGWELNIHPQANALWVNAPGTPGNRELYAMAFATKGWSRLRDLDSLTTGVWQGQFFFGTRDGRVMLSRGFVDEVKLGGDSSQAKDIRAYYLGGYTISGGRLKQPRFMKAHFITRGVSPSFAPIVNFDFDLTEPTPPLVGIPAVLQGAFVWDESNWDEAYWGQTQGVAYVVHTGLFGVGHDVAFGAIWYSHDYAVVAQLEVAWEEGGPL